MKSFFVSPSFLDLCCESNSCMRLSSEHKVKTAALVIFFQSRLWVCTGSRSRGQMNLGATLSECVPAGLYEGPEYDDDKPGYQGMRFTCQRFMTMRWNGELNFVFTGREISVKIVDPSEKNLYRAMR